MVTADGRVLMMGNNAKGQLGLGHTINATVPTMPVSLLKERIIQVCVHSCQRWLLSL